MGFNEDARRAADKAAADAAARGPSKTGEESATEMALRVVERLCTDLGASPEGLEATNAGRAGGHADGWAIYWVNLTWTIEGHRYHAFFKDTSIEKLFVTVNGHRTEIRIGMLTEMKAAIGRAIQLHS